LSTVYSNFLIPTPAAFVSSELTAVCVIVPIIPAAIAIPIVRRAMGAISITSAIVSVLPGISTNQPVEQLHQNTHCFSSSTIVPGILPIVDQRKRSS